ncbi:MAG TPA: HAD-IA family hydrolase [Bacilli bacterium]|nr:HAD-IA family hydrolase [Bacilli bacterium]
MNSAKKVLFWDFDGTLGYREGMWSGTLAQVAREQGGLDLPVEAFRPHLAQGFYWHDPHTPHPHLTTAGAWWQGLHPLFRDAFRNVGCEADTAERLAQHVGPAYTHPAAWRLYDDVCPALDALSERGWTHAIISNHVPELGELLAHLGLSACFAAVINSACVGYEKPHPAIYAHALREMGDPDVAWMVGDNPIADVQGAEQAGLPAILLRKTHPSVRYQSQDAHGVLELVEKAALSRTANRL